ncbi:hydroxyisourate hydrolase [Alteromonas sp. ASW11-36]|uniref:5-hydroxyisourate hydrolase n=1 Tax=Alteromonas arenosi TaxID=3055817 RepID=A0ABT7T0K3_9ALTE|nr:hydroxyisourate hydrolase [Alteromonas sp. ASW11-36]MDM7861344.1 hydroxyisourate hydrolase [Alteromonas sp. ASW11-36]
MSKSPITTHILDTATGTPAAGVPVVLYKLEQDSWVELTRGATDYDGRITDWLSGVEVTFGTYKLHFDLDTYFAEQPEPAFYPFAEICFRRQDNKHHHIPLLLAPFGYSTYRGS